MSEQITIPIWEKSSNSIDEFCLLEDVSRTLAYDEINRGRLKSFTVGRRRLISKDARTEWRLLMEKLSAEEQAAA